LNSPKTLHDLDNYPTLEMVRTAEHYVRMGLTLGTLPYGRKPVAGRPHKSLIVKTISEAESTFQNPYSIALLHGESGTCALDIDSVEETSALFWTLSRQVPNFSSLDDLLNLPTPIIKTGRGIKPLFRMPSGVQLISHKIGWVDERNLADPNLPIRVVVAFHAGNCLDTLPPSPYSSGVRYEWLNGCPTSINDFLLLPLPLLNLWQALAKRNGAFTIVDPSRT
jgi:hypothetical protein